MKLPKLELTDAENLQTVDELLEFIEKLKDYLIIVIKEIEDTLSNIGVDNIKQIDFGMTTLYNLSSLSILLAKVINQNNVTDNLATISYVTNAINSCKTWVTDNFAKK